MCIYIYGLLYGLICGRGVLAEAYLYIAYRVPAHLGIRKLAYLRGFLRWTSLFALMLAPQVLMPSAPVVLYPC